MPGRTGSANSTVSRDSLPQPEDRRFLELAAFTTHQEADALVAAPTDAQAMAARDAMFTQAFQRMPGMNGALLADVLSTLPNDMLHKVDLTSMAHALEVRTPFLDYRVVEFAFSLPAEAKLHQRLRQTHPAGDFRTFAAR